MNRRLSTRPPSVPYLDLAPRAVTFFGAVLLATCCGAISAGAQTRDTGLRAVPAAPATPEIPQRRLQQTEPAEPKARTDSPLRQQLQTPQRLLRPDVLPQGRQQPLPPGPKAEINPRQLAVTEGQPAVFDSKSIADPNVPIAAYQWLGPGRQTSNRQRFVVNTANLQPSTYTITLVVRDQQERQSRDSATLIVEARSQDDVQIDNRAPVARITPGRREVQQGQQAQFDGNRSTDPDGKIRAWTWSLDGRPTNRGRAVQFDTSSLNLGEHSVSLEVIDDRGARDSTRATLTVMPPPAQAQFPVARISPDRSHVNQGSPVRFFSTSYHPDARRRIIRSLWQTSWGQRGSGQYIDIDTGGLNPGEYSIVLNVIDDNQATTSAKAFLIVEAARAPMPPVAIIAPDRNSVKQGTLVTFLDSSYHPNRNTKIVSRRWSTQWGQLQAGASLNVDTASLSPGSYWITLEIVDQYKKTDTARAVLEILPMRPQQPPVARITPKRLEVRQGESARFDGSASSDVDGKIRAWSWDLNNKPVDRRPSVQIDTRDLNPGEYRLRLEVTDEQRLTARDEALLIVAGPSRDFDAAIIELDVLPAPVSPNQEVRIRAVVANRGRDVLRNVPLRFEVGGIRIAEKMLPPLAPGETREITTGWVPKSAGEQIVIATINPENQPQETDRTNNFRRQAVPVLAQPDVRIDPNPLEVSQGDSARFSARFSTPGRPARGDVRYSWRGPGNLTGEGAEFQVDTKELPPGNHKIFLDISERGGFKGTASTTLIVRRAKTEVWLTADSRNPQTGGEVGFTTGIRPELGRVQYKFIFGDGGETEWSSQTQAIHRYEAPGEFTVRVLARQTGVDLGAAFINLSVKDIAYAVSLQTPTHSVRPGDALSFIATVEPPAGDIEYRFVFGDGRESDWTRNPRAVHSYSGEGGFAAAVEARIGSRVIRSPIVRVDVSARLFPWIWLGAGFAVLAAAGAAYMQKTRRLARVQSGFAIVPKQNLQDLRVEVEGKVKSGSAIGLRSVRGETRFGIEAPGAIVNQRHDRG